MGPLLTKHHSPAGTLTEIAGVLSPHRGFYAWYGEVPEHGTRLVFAGRPAESPHPGGGERPSLEIFVPAAVQALAPTAPPAAWLRQVHSSVVVIARAGMGPEGDAVLAPASVSLTPCVVTADCVPVLLSTAGPLAAIHAGWRGLVAGVLGAAVREVNHEANAPAGDLLAAARAWVGPTIGPCCYEVDEEVAERVQAAAPASAPLPVIHRSSGSAKPHLDLPAVAAAQLLASGVADVRVLRSCTRCSPGISWSYRRDGAGCGRNLSFLYRSDS